MGLEWMPREGGLKDHSRHGTQWWGTEAPCVVYEKKPLKDPKGNVVPGLYVSWIRLNNPAQYNSYTTEMVKGVIAGFENASVDREVVAVVFTGTGANAFCPAATQARVFSASVDRAAAQPIVFWPSIASRMMSAWPAC